MPKWSLVNCKNKEKYKLSNEFYNNRLFTASFPVWSQHAYKGMQMLAVIAVTQTHLKHKYTPTQICQHTCTQNCMHILPPSPNTHKPTHPQALQIYALLAKGWWKREKRNNKSVCKKKKKKCIFSFDLKKRVKRNGWKREEDGSNVWKDLSTRVLLSVLSTQNVWVSEAEQRE